VATTDGNGESAARRFLEFFTVNIRNLNTRRAYYRAACKFLDFAEARGVFDLKAVQPMLVAAWIETEGKIHEAQTVKQELAAVRMLFDWLVIGQMMPMNPASAVRGPKYSYRKGKTPVLSREDAKHLLGNIPLIYKDEVTGIESPDIAGLRDRALIALMVYSFARVGAMVKMRVEDYYANGKTWWVRLHEKGGKFHEVPVNHNAEEYLDAYLEAAGIEGEKKTPLFRSVRARTKRLTALPMNERDVLRMIKRRAIVADVTVPGVYCHTFRATGITAYLMNGGTVENAQMIAAHESPRTTKLYDRRSDDISLDEVEKIVL
jgi:site-specific recombinase XerD